ncbi:sugar phosphate isomerase/epimerase family protein [Pelagicoccus sp. SDUM812005]|uniref:sugar phosphate isomerase/epimerase family protein n=1 Tax=Pelagicoccus sp. SDUM812005 TaxID=3041257 RepID=UPI00280D9459|nr:sugar phosphate isomerase/epimerase family protein [Pelagicoccus sp. SDUM812005]MDQ8182037.1 sugar phosphate isomerase/epimerase [Pelagicoccus sp. SDUM812005]
MPKLGINLLNWTASVTEEHFPIIDRLKEIGYDGIEIFTGSQDPSDYQKLGAHLRELGMGITCVTVLGEDTNPVSPNKQVRAKALDQLKWNIDRCVDCGATHLAGPIHSAFATFTRADIQEDEYKRSAEVLYAAGEYAKEAKLTLCPEALNRFECYLCNTMQQLLKLIELTGHSHVKGMFDTHHANIEEKSLPAAIKQIAPHLAHVHLSENDRGTPGSGHIDFPEVLSTLHQIGYDGWLTIEAFSRADPGFANAINVWREFSPPWDIAESGYRYLKAALENSAS